MPLKFNVGDYVRFKKPFVGYYRVGIIESFDYWKYEIPQDVFKYWTNSKKLSIKEPIYRVVTPDNMPFWRPACGLIKSSYKNYIKHSIIQKLEI